MNYSFLNVKTAESGDHLLWSCLGGRILVSSCLLDPWFLCFFGVNSLKGKKVALISLARKATQSVTKEMGVIINHRWNLFQVL